MSFLSLQGVTKRFGSVLALDDVVLTAPQGSRTAIVGPSGSGKSTLLRLLAGFDAPDTGRISLDGEVLADGPAAVPAHRRGIGLVAQEGALFPHLSVAENIGFGLPRGTAGRDARIRSLAGMVELDEDLLRRRPDALSGGQQQRVALARALARQPRLMLLDEPFSALDTGLRASTRKAVSALLDKAGVTTILVTHDQAEAMSFADQVAVMRNGRLLQVGPPRELYLRPSDETVASFLGPAIFLAAQIQGGFAECALGHVPVGGHPAGTRVRIMLRPEQISFVPVCGAAEGIGYAKVIATEFAGSDCLMQVQIEGRAGTDAVSVAIRTSPSHMVPPGSWLKLAVVGTAHVIEASAASEACVD
jgi:iron(III) transport system ATP-binding protein